MSTHPLQQPTRTAHQVNQRHWQLLGLGVIATIVVLTISSTRHRRATRKRSSASRLWFSQGQLTQWRRA